MCFKMPYNVQRATKSLGLVTDIFPSKTKIYRNEMINFSRCPNCVCALLAVVSNRIEDEFGDSFYLFYIFRCNIVWTIFKAFEAILSSEFIAKALLKSLVARFKFRT